MDLAPTPGEVGSPPPLTLTPKALEMAKRRVAEAGPRVVGLRVGIRGGGCAGFSYVLELAEEVREGRDRAYDLEGLRLVIDHRSAELLDGVTLDWETKLLGYGFKWVNPRAKGACGCGESFKL